MTYFSYSRSSPLKKHWEIDMNQERLNYIIPILQAMADGKTILGRSGEGYAFIDIDEDKFFMSSDIVIFWELKIKPEPEVIYVNKTKEEKYFHYTSEKIAKMDTNPSNFCFIAKKFIEVVE